MISARHRCIAQSQKATVSIAACSSVVRSIVLPELAAPAPRASPAPATTTTAVSYSRPLPSTCLRLTDSLILLLVLSLRCAKPTSKAPGSPRHVEPCLFILFAHGFRSHALQTQLALAGSRL